VSRFPDEQLTPRMLAQKLDLFRRADANAQNTRSEISRTRTRLHELENLLATLDAEAVEAAEFAEAYLLRHGRMD
jgi:BMFP domain-containing protein YqiC